MDRMAHPDDWDRLSPLLWADSGQWFFPYTPAVLSPWYGIYRWSVSGPKEGPKLGLTGPEADHNFVLRS